MSGFRPEATNLVTQELITLKYRATQRRNNPALLLQSKIPNRRLQRHPSYGCLNDIRLGKKPTNSFKYRSS